MAVVYTKVFYLTFELSDIKWENFVGENSNFFLKHVAEITGYEKNSFYSTGSFQFIGSEPLSQLQQLKLNTYIKIGSNNGK